MIIMLVCSIIIIATCIIIVYSSTYRALIIMSMSLHLL